MSTPNTPPPNPAPNVPNGDGPVQPNTGWAGFQAGKTVPAAFLTWFFQQLSNALVWLLGLADATGIKRIATVSNFSTLTALIHGEPWEVLHVQ
jgi:hypothetical protein